MAHRVVLFAAHGVQALDVTGPAAVFAAANEARPDADYAVEVVSPDGGLVEASSGVSLGARSIAETPSAGVDTLLVAGHERAGTRKLVARRDAKAWVEEAAAGARRWGSVCSGAFPLAAWGLLAGRRAATHWAGAAELAERFPETKVDTDALYVVDGPVWTSAGVTAGIDMALAMVEADFGADLAAEIARRLVVYLRRPGGQSQFSEPLKTQCAGARSYGELIAWVKANLAGDLSVESLAARAGQSPRTFQRRFAEQTGRTPAAFVEDLRLERAKALIACDAPLQAVAGEIGYSSASQLTTAFRRRFGVAPSIWKAMHAI